jgi:hypothetical protein
MITAYFSIIAICTSGNNYTLERTFFANSFMSFAKVPVVLFLQNVHLQALGNIGIC